MEKINDSRLTPTMERTRSGSMQMFRERNKDDRSFISQENCDVLLKHKIPSMYAVLIDGVWFWDNSCEECNGRPRNQTKSYIECDEHNVCISCGISRREINGSVWGGLNGWTCKPCKSIEDAKIRAEAFVKLDGEEPDTQCIDEIICPHCGTELNSEGVENGELGECPVCEGEYEVEVTWMVSYSTSIVGKRITK